MRLSVSATVLTVCLLSSVSNAGQDQVQSQSEHQRTDFQKCDTAARNKLVSPASAKIYYHSFSDNGYKRPGKPYVICYETRTSDGGFAKVSAACAINDDGTMEVSVIDNLLIPNNRFCRE